MGLKAREVLWLTWDTGKLIFFVSTYFVFSYISEKHANRYAEWISEKIVHHDEEVTPP